MTPTRSPVVFVIVALLFGFTLRASATQVATDDATDDVTQDAAHDTQLPSPALEPQENSPPVVDSAPTADLVTPQELIARGIVFQDLDQNGKFGEGDRVFPDIKISNGTEIVKTDEEGKYEIPIGDDSIVFVIKPSGFRTPLTDNRLPKFFYNHKPNGSPKLRFPGVAPTGPLPQSIDFPLYEQEEPDTFKILLFGDPQPRNKQEVDYISHDVISELVGNPIGSAFGVSLGDLAFDNLDTLEPLNQTIALIGVPWYNVIGNHDLNLDTKERCYINETFERFYGPSYYSFDYGQVHFIVLDNIDWKQPDQRVGRYHYGAKFGKQQLEFVKQDLDLIPENQMVVLLMHVPITTVEDKLDLFQLIEDRPFCVSISGHTHYHAHKFLGKQDGFNGKQEHHHIINVTLSGSWWSGAKDERGIPHTTMADGAPNGYSIMTFTDEDYRLDFKAAGRPASEQLWIRMSSFFNSADAANQEVWVNVFNGSSKSTVEMSIDNSDDWVPLERTLAKDPHYQDLIDGESKFKPAIEPKLAKPVASTHLWTAKLPAELSPGTHLLRVRTKDMHDRTYFGHRSFRVE